MLSAATALSFPLKTEAAATISFLQFEDGLRTDAASETFTDQDIGAPASDRIFFVVVTAEDKGGGTTLNSFTINGSPANIVHQEFDAGNGDLAAIAWKNVPIGTTANVVLNFNGTVDSGISLYRATGIGISPTAYDSATDQDDAISMAIDIPRGGILLATAAFKIDAAATTVGVTEDVDELTNPDNAGFAERALQGHAGPLSAEINRTVSFTQGNGDDAAGIAVSYAPGKYTFQKPPNNLGLVGYWSFNEGTSTNATDFSGNGNTGTLSGSPLPTWINGKRGKGNALDFAGGSYVTMGTPSSLSLSSVGTVAAWFKRGGDSSFPVIVGNLDFVNDSNGYQLSMDIGGRVRLELANGTSYIPLFSDAGGFDDDQWHQAVGTWDGSTMNVYVDGVPVGSTGQAGVNAVSGVHPIVVGKESANDDGYFFGSIDDVRIYNRALSPTQVAKLYGSGAVKVGASSVALQQGSSLERGLVGHWTFDSPDTRTTITDRSGQNNNGYFIGGATSSAKINGKLGQALNFDGSDDYVAVGSSVSTNPTIKTLSAWIYPRTLGELNFGTIMAAELGSLNFRWFFTLCSNSGSECPSTTNAFVYYQAATLEGGEWYAPANSIRLNQWQHVVIAYDCNSSSNDPVFYVNGQSVTVTEIKTPTGSPVCNEPGITTSIGSDPLSGTDATFDGKIDDVRIYNRALSPTEVKQLYQLGAVRITQ